MDSCFEDGLIKEEYDEIEEVSMHLVLSNQEGEQAAKRRKAQVLKKPKLPQFAFEWFRQKTKAGEEEEQRPEPSLLDMVGRWKQLSEEGRQHYIELAEQDRLRFEKQYEEWRSARAQQGKNEPLWQDLVEKRRSTLERCLTRVDGAQKKESSRQRPPVNFPKPAIKSAYGLFCSEQRGNEKGEKKSGVGVLKALRSAWKSLAAEEQQGYALRAAEDQERFRAELQAWRNDPANANLMESTYMKELLAREGKTAARGSKKLPKPRVARCEALVRPAAEEEIMFDVLTGTQVLYAKERTEERRQRPPKEDALPNVEQEADTTVDDLLGDLLAVEADSIEDGHRSKEPAARVSAFGNLPQASGPQLCLDESGNIVLNQSSLSRSMEAQAPVEEAAEVHEAVCQYVNAYKRTPVCKWTSEETELFYEALSLYGTDLFLVQTFFRNKSAGQIKTKYSKELKRNPKLVQEALTSKAKRLTKDSFERLHGKIDISKHYKPPPSPQPGDEEPEVVPPEDDYADLGGMPPPEPEFCAEDESLTTNRLMALFD